MSKSKTESPPRSVAAPSYLSAKARKLWRDIHTSYELEPEAVELLRVALENLDLGDRARELLRKEGPVTAKGTKHPALDASKLHDGMFARFIRQLGLDIVAPGPNGRPPGR